ncbi:MAG: iron ABC transporter permease [Pseudomonadota bacterium]
MDQPVGHSGAPVGTGSGVRRSAVGALGQGRRARGKAFIIGCAVVAGCGGLLGIALGPLGISVGDVLVILLEFIGLSDAESISNVKIGVVENIRLPRVILGLFVGASLGLAGAAMQGFFRNPLADPSLIGVSAGGAFAAVSMIVLGDTLLVQLRALLGGFALPIAAFCGSLIAIAAIYRLASINRRVIVATMLLAGVAANALASAGIGYMTFLANDLQLRDLTFWTLGSLGGATWATTLPVCALMAASIAGLLTLQRAMNCLLLGEGDAFALGVNVERVKLQAGIFTALGVGAATAACGTIGFIGLVVPHLVRLVTGPDHRYVLPGSAFLGAALVVGADLVARLSVAPAELPLGVVTAAIGAPFFFWLLLRDKARVQDG